MFPRLFGAVRAPPMLADLLPVLRRFQPSLVVHDAGEFAASIAAATAGVPSLTHSYGALTPAERVTAAADQVAPLWEAQALAPPPFAGSYEHLYLDIYPPSLQTADMAHVPAAQLLRPVTFASTGREILPESVERNGATPLVYVTFGTVYNKDVSLVATVVEVLVLDGDYGRGELRRGRHPTGAGVVLGEEHLHALLGVSHPGQAEQVAAAGGDQREEHNGCRKGGSQQTPAPARSRLGWPGGVCPGGVVVSGRGFLADGGLEDHRGAERGR
jgi:hypothetical protein